MKSRDDHSPEAGGQSRYHLPLLLVLLYALTVSGYFVVRYQARWMDNDTARMILLTQIMREEGTIQPAQDLYAHGFAYQVASVFFQETTGLSLQALQTVIFPLLALMVLGTISFALFSQIVRGRWIATLATLLLLFQPDLLFVSMRGSHEKLDWPLMMLALLLFYGGVGRSPRAALPYVGLFYMTVFTLGSVNVFFASSFLFALVLSLLLGQVVSVVFHGNRSGFPSDLSRLVYVSLACFVLLFLSMFYVYPPSIGDLRTMRNIWEQTSAVTLGFESLAQPYAYIQTGWISRSVYFALTAFSWLLILLSFVAWLWRGREILSNKKKLDLSGSMDWLLYAGFALQVALGIVVDMSGVLSANMQLRVFPGFVIMAVAFVARSVWRLFAWPRTVGWKRVFALGLAGAAGAWFAISSVWKSTNEPVLSNMWLFHSPSEETTLVWAENHIESGGIWSGLDERINVALVAEQIQHPESFNIYDSHMIKDRDRYLLLSERERIRALRMGASMPNAWDWYRVYDNGDVSLTHKRPETPYQR